MNYLDLLKLLPKTNCKACGVESCLLFALKVFSKELSPEACPYLDLKVLPSELFSAKITFNQLQENLKYLKKRFTALSDFPERAINLGCYLESANKVIFPYLDLEIQIELTPEKTPLKPFAKENFPLDPRDEILLYNYFIFNGKEPLTLDFIGLESFPHSISKVKTLKIYAEDPLTELFSKNISKAEALFKNFRINNFYLSSNHFSVTIWVLPKVPLKINFWEGDEEEGLPPSCKILYDRSALSYLDLECLVFCAERLSEKLKERALKSFF